MALPDKDWELMTEQEKLQWVDAADKNSPHLIGGIRPSGEDFHRTVRSQWRRKEGKHIY